MTDISMSITGRIERSVNIVRSGKGILPLKTRRIFLERMLQVLRKYSDSAIDALRDELGREKYDSYIFELMPLIRCIKYLKKT